MPQIPEIEHYQKMSSHAENLPQGAEKEPSFGGRMSGGLWSAAKLVRVSCGCSFELHKSLSIMKLLPETSVRVSLRKLLWRLEKLRIL